MGGSHRRMCFLLSTIGPYQIQAVGVKIYPARSHTQFGHFWLVWFGLVWSGLVWSCAHCKMYSAKDKWYIFHVQGLGNSIATPIACRHSERLS